MPVHGCGFGKLVLYGDAHGFAPLENDRGARQIRWRRGFRCVAVVQRVAVRWFALCTPRVDTGHEPQTTPLCRCRFRWLRTRAGDADAHDRASHHFERVIFDVVSYAGRCLPATIERSTGFEMNVVMAMEEPIARPRWFPCERKCSRRRESF